MPRPVSESGHVRSRHGGDADEHVVRPVRGDRRDEAACRQVREAEDEPVARCAQARRPRRPTWARGEEHRADGQRPDAPERREQERRARARARSPPPRADFAESTTPRASRRATGNGGERRGRDRDAGRARRTDAPPARQPSASASPSGLSVGSSGRTAGAASAPTTRHRDHASRRQAVVASSRGVPERDEVERGLVDARRRRGTRRRRGRRSRRAGRRRARAPRRRAGGSAPRARPRCSVKRYARAPYLNRERQNIAVIATNAALRCEKLAVRREAVELVAGLDRTEQLEARAAEGRSDRGRLEALDALASRRRARVGTALRRTGAARSVCGVPSIAARDAVRRVQDDRELVAGGADARPNARMRSARVEGVRQRRAARVRARGAARTAAGSGA